MKKTGAAILLFSTAACTTLQPVANPDAFFAKNNPRFIVVTTTEQAETGSETMAFYGPVVREGTISGLVYNEQTSMPVTQVRTIMAPQFNKRRTTMAVLLGGAVVGGLGVLMTMHNKDGKQSVYHDPSCGHSPHCYKPMEEL